jgi:hypothetical protein
MVLTTAFPTRQVFHQRGNTNVFAVQWRGDNLDQVKEFVEPRYGTKVDAEALEWFVTKNGDLLLHDSLDLEAQVICRTWWLVAQPHAKIRKVRFVFCDEERFNALYEETPPGSGKDTP